VQASCRDPPLGLQILLLRAVRFNMINGGFPSITRRRIEGVYQMA
jgi:hypothetical protein